MTFTIKPEQEQAFLDAAREFIAKVHQTEPGAVLYALTKHATEPPDELQRKEAQGYRDEAIDCEDDAIHQRRGFFQ